MALIVETIPRLMTALRAELRHGSLGELSMPQFRALGYLKQSPGASVCAVAEHLGLSVSNVSKLLFALAERGMVEHASVAKDRRRVSLLLTAQGSAVLEAALYVASQRLVELLRDATPEELTIITAAMRSLQRLLPAVPSTQAQG